MRPRCGPDALLLLSAAVWLGADAASQRSAARARGSAVTKIVQMLGEMKAKTQADVASEKKSFEEFMGFCDDQASDKEYAIKTTDRQIQDLKADIEKATAESESMTDQITEIGQLISEKEEELKKATKLREEGVHNFRATEEEMLKSIQELAAASETLKKSGSSASFLEVDSSSSDRVSKIAAVLSKVVDSAFLAAPQRLKVQSFLQASDEDKEGDAGAVGEVVEDTREKAENELSDCRKAEQEAQQNFELMRQSLNNELKTQKEKLAECTNNKAAADEAIGAASGDLDESKRTKDADSKYLATLRIDCQQKAVEWEQRMRDAKGEIEAISKATEILQAGVKSLIQVSARTLRTSAALRARAHLRARRAIRDPFADDDDDDDGPDDDSQDEDDRNDSFAEDSLAQANTRIKVVDRLHGIAKQYHSFVLTQIANRAKADPFAKIKTLIEEMIAKLMQEAAAEATQKAFCDEEIGKSKSVQEQKGGKLAKVASRLDQASAAKAQLESQVKDIQADIAEIDKAQAEATKIRQEEKADFQKTQADLKSSTEACAQAVGVLKSYYDGASFIQLRSSTMRASSRSRDAGPEAGAQIIDFLMMAEEDFAKQLADIETEESKDRAAFEKLTQENKLSKATKEMEAKGKLSESKSLQVKIDDHTEDKADLEKELQAVDMYLEKLKPQCETKTMSPEQKMAARKAEIEGLKEALRTLEDGV